MFIPVNEIKEAVASLEKKLWNKKGRCVKETTRNPRKEKHISLIQRHELFNVLTFLLRYEYILPTMACQCLIYSAFSFLLVVVCLDSIV